jgi:hypothetical protein
MGMKPRAALTGLFLIAGVVAFSIGAGGPSAAKERRQRPAVIPPYGNLIVSRSVYAGKPETVTVGQVLPGGGNAVANGTYPGVWANEGPDPSFGVTSPISIDRGALVGATPLPLSTFQISDSQLVTSFSSKSEMGLHLSTDGTQISFMGYLSPINQLDVSNSNTPNHFDPTNPVGITNQRGVALFDALTLSGAVQVTPVNAYSGNNGRGAILDSTGNLFYLSGNAGNGTFPHFAIVGNTGVQTIAPGAASAESQVIGTQHGNDGDAKGYQFGFAVQDPPLSWPADKSGKDDNYRGITIHDNTLYVTKGSGGNGVNTVYQVGTAGTLPTLQDTPITILPGFPTILASTKTPKNQASPVMNPFGLWFADSSTLYVADEGNGPTPVTLPPTPPNPNAGIQKWVLQNNGTWKNVYTLQNPDREKKYVVPGMPVALNPAPDGFRALTGRVNGDGTVTLFAVTSTISASVDQGADPNQLLTITDTVAFKTLADASGEKYTVLQTAAFGEVLRGVEFVPLSGDLYAANLLESAQIAIAGLPASDFKNQGAQDSLVSIISFLVSDLRNGTAGAAVDNRIENIIKKAGAISDPVARAAILAKLNVALGVYSGE